MAENLPADERYALLLAELHGVHVHPVGVAAFVDAARSSMGEPPADMTGFLRFLAERAKPFSGASWLPPLARAADMLLSYRCLSRQRAALSSFTHQYRGVVAAVARKFRQPEDDLLQAVWVRLLSGEEPKLREYEGRGSLSNFVRLVASRMAIDGARKRGESLLGASDDQGTLLLDPKADPELSHFQARYQVELAEALRDAVRELTLEQRAVLRSHYVHRLGIDALAVMLGCHRSSAARKLVDAREALVREVHGLLRARLGLSRAEWESIGRVVQSRLDVSMGELFHTLPEEET